MYLLYFLFKAVNESFPAGSIDGEYSASEGIARRKAAGVWVAPGDDMLELAGTGAALTRWPEATRPINKGIESSFMLEMYGEYCWELRFLRMKD